MERRVIAELIIDEDIAARNAEVNGIPYNEDLGYLRREFGWLEQSGIRIEKTFISDDNDDDWRRYINYIMSWAFNHSCDDNYFAQVMTYNEWRIENCLPVYPLSYRKKIPVIFPRSGAEMFIASLGAGELTNNGDRTSGYYNVATNFSNDKFVRAALIEEAKDLHPEDQGYALHIINDIDEIDSKVLRTATLDKKELEMLLKDVLESMQEGRM